MQNPTAESMIPPQWKPFPGNAHVCNLKGQLRLPHLPHNIFSNISYKRLYVWAGASYLGSSSSATHVSQVCIKMKSCSSSACRRQTLFSHQLFPIAFNISWWEKMESKQENVNVCGWGSLLLLTSVENIWPQSHCISQSCPPAVRNCLYLMLVYPAASIATPHLILYIASDVSATSKNIKRKNPGESNKERSVISYCTILFF